MEFLVDCGLQVAVIGATLAVGLACAGSGRGVGIVGEAAAGVLSEDPAVYHDTQHHVSVPGLDPCHHTGHSHYRSECVVQMDRRGKHPGNPGSSGDFSDCCGSRTVHFVLYCYWPLHFGSGLQSGGGQALWR